MDTHLPHTPPSDLSVYNSAQLTRYVYDVLQVLKKEEKPLDRNEMIRKLAFDVFDNDDLMEILMRNEKIDFDPSNMSFSYKVSTLFLLESPAVSWISMIRYSTDHPEH